MGLFDYLFSWMCKRVFKKVDYNNNGLIEPLEVEVAILALYNIINKRLPGWQDPPNRDAIQAALKSFDDDHNGALDDREFERFAKSLMSTGPDMFFARVGKDAVVKTALLPALTVGVKKAGGELPGMEGLKDVPLAVLAPALGVAFNAIKALVPY
uniref:EF-hand domain-containing protein n=1 Tax=Tetradesmus obliquus TaxID=3088 RepID=A0A383V315_TETOB|eukprot:jgi/Sobl393_1/7713/SZX59481.1